MRTLARAVAFATLLVLAGCSASGSSGDSGVVTEEMAPAADGGGVESDGTVGVVGADTAVADEDRQVVVTGSVSLQVVDPVASAQDVAELVEAVGGVVSERVEQTAREGIDGSAYLVVRIPADEVSATLEQLGRLGTVVDTSLMSTEVTAQARDLDARIRALEISVARLEDLLGRSGTIADVVEAEQVLTDRQSQLESLQSQRTDLADQVDMSTIRLDLWTEAAVPDEPPTGFLAGLETGWKALVATLRGALALLGVLLPWLVFGALVTAVVVAIRRAVVRRRPTRAVVPPDDLHPSPPAPGPTPGAPSPGASPTPTPGPTTTLPPPAPPTP